MKSTIFTSPSLSIGLTGGIGSGKTTVANIFSTYGISSIDTDIIAHKISAPGGAAIASILAIFGPEFITLDGAMNREKMRTYIFKNYAAKKQLEEILHPLIYEETNRIATTMHSNYLIFVVPLLIESQKQRYNVKRILVVDCQEEIQIIRVMQRNYMTRKQVLAIMATQVTRKKRLMVADDIIYNNLLNTTALLPQIKHLHEFYSSLVVNTM